MRDVFSLINRRFGVFAGEKAPPRSLRPAFGSDFDPIRQAAGASKTEASSGVNVGQLMMLMRLLRLLRRFQRMGPRSDGEPRLCLGGRGHAENMISVAGSSSRSPSPPWPIHPGGWPK